MGEVGRALGGLDGDVELDAVVAEAFAQASRDQDDGGVGEAPQPDGLGLLVGGSEGGEVHGFGFDGDASGEGVRADGGFLEEPAGVADVGGKAAGVGTVAGVERLEKRALRGIVCSGRVPVGEEMGLVLGEEGFGEGDVVGSEDSGGEVVVERRGGHFVKREVRGNGGIRRS